MTMSQVLVLYYSSYGHIEAMAAAVAEGPGKPARRSTSKRVPELVPDKAARDAHYKVD
jgi:NAD(P)H dehydrogenase (quinone)